MQPSFVVLFRLTFLSSYENHHPSFLSYPSYNGIVVLFRLMFSNSTCTFLQGAQRSL